MDKINLQCANFTIPLVCVQSISWTKRAKTVSHQGGYVSSRGFEACEISVKVRVEYTILKQLGLDADSIYNSIKGLVTDRSSESGVFYMAGYPIYPEMEFTPTNINKTYITDTAKVAILEADMVFSGVSAVKEVSRERALELSPFTQIPELTLTVDNKDLIIQDSCSLNEFVSQPDSLSFTVSIGSDMDLVSRDGFLDALLKGGTVTADLPQGITKYYVIDANLVEEQLSITASLYPSQALKVITRTYQDTDLSSILEDLAKEAGIEIDCKTKGHIDYYKAHGNPVRLIKELQSSAGFLMSYRQGILTCVDVPESISTTHDLPEYLEMEQDSSNEPIHGLYWYDGVNQFTAGELDATAETIYSVFRSNNKSFADRCLKYRKYLNCQIVVNGELQPNIVHHSALNVHSNDKIIPSMVEWYEQNWIDNTANYELHYIGG